MNILFSGDRSGGDVFKGWYHASRTDVKLYSSSSGVWVWLGTTTEGWEVRLAGTG